MALKVQEPPYKNILPDNIQLLVQKIMQISRENIFMSVLENVSPLPVTVSSNYSPYINHHKPSSTIPNKTMVKNTVNISNPELSLTESHSVGSVSAMFESGGRNSAGVVGYDPNGGTSYGIYQISSKQGSMKEFLNFLKKVRPDWFHRLRKAGPPNTGSTKGAFPREWKAIARENPQEFAKIQHEFIKEKYFKPLCKLLAKELDLNIENSHPAIKEAIWSTAVQHGVNGAKRIIEKAYISSGKELSDKFVDTLYGLRSSSFPSSPSKIQKSVVKRFQLEKELILAKLQGKNNAFLNMVA